MKDKKKTPAKKVKAGKEKKIKQKQPPKRKNVSQKVPNGKFVITNDQNFQGTDGKSKKQRMATVVDSNRKNEVALVKYTTSEKHGKSFKNSKGFKGHGDKIYTLDNEGKPIKLDNKKFVSANDKRNISVKEANEIKRWNVKESRYKAGNKANLKRLKGRAKKK